METAIRWSPSSTAEDQRFLYVDIPGKQFNLCKVTSRDRKRGTLNYEIQASRQSVPPFQAFDWSPADEKLVVVGQSSGEAAVLRLDDDSQPIVLPLRNQRACNAVAFNTQGLLATGLDKVRNDFSLNIWNIHQRLPLANVGRSFNSTRNPIEPYRKLASSERITSVKFFKDQPEVLVAGVTGQYVRIYDLREASGSPSLQFSTRCVHNLAIDWLDENYIASCYPQREASICVWDRRSGFRYPAAVGAVLANADSGQLGPALELKPTIDSSSSICSLRFSRTRRGCLGMLSTKGNFKCYDIAKEYMSDEYRTSLEHALGGNSSKHYAEQIYTKKVSDFRPTAGTPDQTANPESLRVTSFDFLNTTLSSQPLAITLSTEKTVSLFSPPSPSPCIDISPTCTISCASTIRDDANSSLITPTSFLGMKAGDLNQILSGRSFVSSIEDTNTEATNSEKLDCVVELSSRGKRERLFTAGKMNSISDALTKLTIPRLRCLEGYLLDSEKNKSVLADDPSLQELWSWIGRARSYSAGDSMIVHGVDMNYLGICNIWNGNFGRSHSSRTHGSHPSDYANINGLLQEIVRKLKLAEGKTCVSAFPEKRQLCLHACGVPESIEDLKSQIDQLVTEKLHTKAAALAILQDEPKLAYTALRENKPTQAHKLLAMAIIGASKGDTGPEWQETCDEIAAELTDPYARAILALVSKGNWKSVIQETTLPLKYRVEVALRWLPDDELTTYLEESTTEATRQGDIEGIILTGLDHGGLDLFQSYINKFHDVQTPVLAMCHTVPRFIADAPSKRRFEAWRETYRQQMNSWKLHLNRVKFDVESRKLAMTWEGRRLVEPPLQQISLVCNYCTRPLSQQDALNAELSVAQTAGPEFMHPTAGHPLGPSLMGGTVCPKCSRHMPRCGICSLWLGSPDPRSKAAIAEDAKKSAPSKHDATDIMKRFIVFCIQCNHGFHADHARDWFVRHRTRYPDKAWLRLGVQNGTSGFTLGGEAPSRACIYLIMNIPTLLLRRMNFRPLTLFIRTFASSRFQPPVFPAITHTLVGCSLFSPRFSLLNQSRCLMPPRGTRKEPSREVKISKELSYVLRHAAEREKIQIDKQGYVNVEHLLQYRKLKGLNVTLEDILDAVLTSDKQRFGLLYSPNQLTPSERDTKESVAIAGDEGGVNAPSDTTNSVHPTATQQALAANDPDPRHYMIRARQGHSMKLIEMESLLQKLTPSENSSDLLPETVVHGTYHATWPKILESGGLRCMGRTHIHFASGPPLSSVLLRSKVDGESEVAREAKGQKEPEGVISGMRGDAQILIYIDIKRAQAAGCPFWISENGVILSEGMPTDDKQDGMVPTEFFDVVVERKNGLGILWENGALAQPVPDWMICAKVPQGKGPRKNKGGKAASRLQLEGQLDPVYP